jgi:hypothetical protein
MLYSNKCIYNLKFNQIQKYILQKRMEKKNLNGVEKEANGCLAASKNEEVT